MEFTCMQQDIARALTVVNYAVPRRNTWPILSHILLTAEEDRVTISAANGEGLMLRYRISATVEASGHVALPTKLIEYVANLQSPEFTLSLAEEDWRCALTCGRSRATIHGTDPAEFPLFPPFEEGMAPTIIDVALLKEAIKQVSFAAAKDESRPVLTALFMVSDERGLTCVAADSFRIAVRTLPVGGDQGYELLLPASAMNLLARVLPSKGTVSMRVTPTRNQVLFQTDHIDLSIGLLAGPYPDYQAAFPQTYTACAIVKREEFALAVKEVASFALNESKSVQMNIYPADSLDGESNTLMLQSWAEDVGNTVSVIEATVLGDQPETLYLNVKYLVDVLSAIDTPDIAIEVEHARRPVVIKPVGAIDYQYVVMVQSPGQVHAPPSVTTVHAQ